MTGPDAERAFELIRLRKYAHARDEAQRCIAGDPGDAQAFGALSLACAAQGDYPAAREAAGRAIQLAPGSHTGYFVMARAVLEDEHFEPNAGDWGVRWHLMPNKVCAEIAIQNLREALAIAPGLSTLHGYMGLALSELGKDHDALRSARHGLRLDANDELCLVVAMGALHRLGRADEAVATAHSLLRIDADHPAAHSLLAGVAGPGGEAAGDHAATMLRQAPDSRLTRIRADFLALQHTGWLAAPARLVGRVSGCARTPGRWALVLLVGALVLVGLRLCIDPAVGFPLSVVLIAAMYLTLLGAFTDWALVSAVNALRPPRLHDGFSQWVGYAGYAWLFPMPMIALAGMWHRPHVFWGLIFLFALLDLFRAGHATLGRANDLIPYDWDLVVAVLVGVVMAPASILVLLLLPVEKSVLTVLPWMVVSMALTHLPNMVHGIEQVEGRYVSAQAFERHQKDRKAEKKQRCQQKTGGAA